MMTEPSAIRLGDPVPLFSGRTLAGNVVDLHVNAGRWVVLAFLGDLNDRRAAEELGRLIGVAKLVDEDQLCFFGVLTHEPVAAAQALIGLSGPALGFIADYDGAISRLYGALGSPRSIVLDPLLRAVANVGWDGADDHAAMIMGFLRTLPSVDDSAGVPLTAPVLMVPRVFDFELCDFLIDLYESNGGDDSGFMLDQDGKSATVVDYRFKRRQDFVIGDPQVKAVIRDRVVRRLLPAMEQFLGYRATRLDRYMVSCYDADLGGYFYRHRDNVNAGAEHRRFAVSINLNRDYDGCDLIFPEFGRKTYRAPCGGAVVFSCGMLHQVTPVTRGKRYAFVPFLYGEDEARIRLGNNSRLREGEFIYTAETDALFPGDGG